MPAVCQKAVSIIICLSASLKYSRVLIKAIALSINENISFCHCSIYRVKVICSIIGCLPSLYHMSVIVIAHPLAYLFSCFVGWIAPFARRRLLINILIHCYSPILHTVKPVPGFTWWVINFFSAIGSVNASIRIVPDTLTYTVFIPVAHTILSMPAINFKRFPVVIQLPYFLCCNDITTYRTFLMFFSFLVSGRIIVYYPVTLYVLPFIRHRSIAPAQCALVPVLFTIVCPISTILMCIALVRFYTCTQIIVIQLVEYQFTASKCRIPYQPATKHYRLTIR